MLSHEIGSLLSIFCTSKFFFWYLFSDSLTRRRALDPIEKHHLRTYIRQRKSSIVQHVIGYNYDDNSTAGGLYTRAGIGSKLNKKIEMIAIVI